MERLRRALHALLWRAPWLRSTALNAIDLAVRPLLLPFRQGRPGSDPEVAAALEARTDEFNRAAETYYAGRADAAHLLDKPFSEPAALSRRLIDVGVLIDGLRLQPGDLVVELGAGTAWVSHILNKSGYATIAIDVSPTALALARQAFERDPRTNWSLEPRFLAYDGHTLPLEDASVDRIVLYDAYHHIPNPGPLLREMRRVLKPDGIVGMSEPGRGHSHSAPSVAEAASTGVLENELAIEAIASIARGAGFAAARVVVASQAPLLEIDADDLRPFMGGRGLARYWKNLCAALDGHHYLLLFAGPPVATTARPRRLNAVIRRSGGEGSVRLRRGVPGSIAIELRNAGDTRWIAGRQPGWTRIGVHLLSADARRTPSDFDWVRVPLPRDVEPEETVGVTVGLPPVDQPGRSIIVIDLVIEGVAWFADRGSMPLEVICEVE